MRLIERFGDLRNLKFRFVYEKSKIHFLRIKTKNMLLKLIRTRSKIIDLLGQGQFALHRFCSTAVVGDKCHIVKGQKYPSDDWTNITPKILSLMDRNLAGQPGHPLYLITKRIEKFFQNRFEGQSFETLQNMK